MQKETNWATIMSAICLVAILVMGLATYAGFNSINDKVEANKVDEQAIVDKVLEGIVIPEVEQPVFPDYIMNEDEYEDNASEDKAEELATEYLSDKDFLEDLANYLNDLDELSGLDEDEISVEILDVDVKEIYGPPFEKDDYKVIFKLKVYEYEDKIAKIDDVVIRVTDVNYDNDFEDVEVDEDYDFFDLVVPEDIRIY